MNKTIFSLICTNEDYEIVSISHHSTLASAQKQMQSEYDRELIETKKAGYDRSDIEHICIEKNAYIECSDSYKYHWDIKEASLPSADESITDRQLAMREMERELIQIVNDNGDEDGVLIVEDLYMSWSEECDGDVSTTDITAISVQETWDGDVHLMVLFDDEDERPFSDCDQNDLGSNLADYIYNEIKTAY